MMKTIPSNPESFWQLVEREEPTVIIFGEDEEQWTEHALAQMRKQEVPVHFFSWEACEQLRTELDICRYPVVQVWCDGKTVSEMIGYRAEDVRAMTRTYLNLRNNRSVRG